MEYKFRRVQDGTLHLCFSDGNPTSIQVMATKENKNFLRKLVMLGQIPRLGEHVSVYFRIIKFHYDNKAREVKITGYFCRNHHEGSIITEIELSGTCDMVEEVGSLKEFKEHPHIPSESYV